MTTVYTVGHSTRSADEFLRLLRAFAIELVADIRTVPRSRRHPQFERTALEGFLAAHQIEYRHMPALGGLRRPQKHSINTGWQNESFRGYADYMQTAAFENGINDLIDIARQKRTAIMCAEAVPWRCHRSLVSDALLVRGIGVEDIMNEKTFKPHKLTQFARVDGLRISYPAPQLTFE